MVGSVMQPLTWLVIWRDHSNLPEVLSEAEGGENLPRSRPDPNAGANLRKFACSLVDVNLDIAGLREGNGAGKTPNAPAADASGSGW